MPALTTNPSTPPKPAGQQLSMPASVEYRRWLAEVARMERSTIASFIDRLVVDFAASKGYPAPPPRHARD